MDSLHVPDREGSPQDILRSAIGGTGTLLVLDNCEHLVDACAELSEFLLRGCPKLRIVATSREALGVSSETSWLVPPLESQEALQLFVDRAQSTLATFRLTDSNVSAVRDICRRLDGLPLAIELAAARVRVLSPEQIADRLTDAFRLLSAGSRTALPRHRTLRATIDWSHSLLSQREQVLLARLSVFSGTFSLDAVEAVCAGDPLADEDLLDGISALVEKSLIVMVPDEGVARYRLLETVRQYALERLDAADELEARRARHAVYFTEYFEQVAPKLIGGEHERGLTARVRADNDNLRATLTWAIGSNAPALALRLTGTLAWYWYCTGQFHDAVHFTRGALALGASADPVLRGRALSTLGIVSLARGDYDTSCAALEEALPLLRQSTAIADREAAAIAQAKLGAACLMLGHYARADALLDETLTQMSDVSPMVPIFTLVWQAWGRLARGDLAEARRMFTSNRDLGYAIEHRTTIAHSMAFAGFVAALEGNLDLAIRELRESLRLHIELNDFWGFTIDFDGLTVVAVNRKDWERAAGMIAGVDALRERTGIALMAVARDLREQMVSQVRRGLGDDYQAVSSQWRVRSFEEIVQLANEIASSAEPTVVPAPEAEILVEAPPAVLSATAEHRVRVAQRLKVHALGPLEVFIGARQIESAAWGSARPRELLAYLLMHPAGCTKEQVGVAFWPDATSAQLRNSFHVTLHRLRKALGMPEWITLNKERYRVDPTAVAEFDVAMFEESVGTARRGLKRGEPDAVAALERAVGLYRGDFLDGEPAGDWHLEFRDRLQRIYLDALMELGATLTKEERHARAAEVYRRVLARDELHEEAVRALMTSLARQGERAPALRLYQKFADRLQKELEAEPDEETTELFQRLKQGA
jgi:predicted ATPase/two-component SAPR family response regulator